MEGILYVVSTPIGNLGDITYRAVENLKHADLIACEDTRHSKILLSHYNIHKPLLSYFDFSERQKAPALIEKIKKGAHVALISDAGTPGVADPGFRLISLALKEGVKVEVLPGASAFLTALIASGLPVDRFIFEGFLPVKQGALRRKLASLKGEQRTVIFYESPHRLLKTLSSMQEILGNVELVVARELTKKFEEIVRKKAGDMIEYFSKKKIQGEFVILLNLRSVHERA